MMKHLILCLTLLAYLGGAAQRTVTYLTEGWKFSNQDCPQAVNVDFDDRGWQKVTVPHDWAIYGPFDINNDLQTVAITQDGERQASLKTGRTGGLPYVGVGWYRTYFDADPQGSTTLVFDGIMSGAEVYVNGNYVGSWPYGYNSFYFDVSSYINIDGEPNTLVVRAENLPQSSRWYPGAGIYRNVKVISTDDVHVPVWGTQITTPFITKEFATVRVSTDLVGNNKENAIIKTTILDDLGNIIASKESAASILPEQPTVHNLEIANPKLWSPESPTLYTTLTQVEVEGNIVDQYKTRFGIRKTEFIPGRGFYLNGQNIKFKGVCNHHDLGPLGAAVNRSALQHQLELLKDMGCNAVRTSHNMPDPQLVELCDSMGLMMMLEPFDEWNDAKCRNGYHRLFDEWAQKDLVNMIHQYRNNPSVVMWSIGNEVPTQCAKDGWKTAKMLQDICHKEDPTRPVTCGMDQVSCVLDNGFASVIDIPGLNYRTQRYLEAHDRLNHNLILGSETASTVSSRGVYKFPLAITNNSKYDDHQMSGYDTESCPWSNIPDIDFALSDDYEWEIGQFVWTGFDYLGEPSPYSTDAWPSHSSLFGIIDLASIPKDRYYLYRSVWNPDETTLHIVPHWTWPEREGLVTPIMVYTNLPKAELFINGKSMGIQRKLNREEVESLMPTDSLAILRRYRLLWDDVIYTPGEIKVVGYDENNNVVATKSLHTSGKPHHIELKPNRTELLANGQDLCYITVSVVDENGNLCPEASNVIKFDVKGKGAFKAVANGDATSLESFYLPQMSAFKGKLTLIVSSSKESGPIQISASSKKLKPATLSLEAR